MTLTFFTFYWHITQATVVDLDRNGIKDQYTMFSIISCSNKQSSLQHEGKQLGTLQRDRNGKIENNADTNLFQFVIVALLIAAVVADEAYPKPAYTKSHDYVSQLDQLP